jgi:hypothetical protein
MDKRRRKEQIEQLDRDVEELRDIAPGDTSDADLERIRRGVLELRREFYIHRRRPSHCRRHGSLPRAASTNA